MNASLSLAPAPAVDLATYLGRARRLDPEAVTKLQSNPASASAPDGSLAVFTAALAGGSGPTVLGLRVLPLAQNIQLDASFSVAALLDRLARWPDGQPVTLALPPAAPPVGTSWLGVLPPRTGWQLIGTIPDATVAAAAASGIAEVAAHVNPAAGPAAVAGVRAQVWGRDLGPDLPIPAGAAFGADALGFLAADQPIAWYRSGPWHRLTTARGHILTRTPVF